MEFKTVLFVSHSALLYGAERCLLDIVCNLPDRIRPLVLLPSYGPLTTVLSDNKIDFIVVPFRGWTGRKLRIFKAAYRFLANIAACIRIIHSLKNIRIDLVYANTLFAPMGALLSFVLRVPLIWHVHEFVNEHFESKFDYGIYISMKVVNKVSNLVVCNSSALKINLSRFVSNDKIHLVYNGMLNISDKKTIVYRKSLRADKIVSLVIVGSITANKRQSDAIMAVSELINIGKNVKLSIVGSGDESYISELNNLVRRLGIMDRINWEGFKEDVSDCFMSADIALVCSSFETFGRVVVEAMSVGCPVVATNTGGIPEIITNELDGLLYNPGDYRQLAQNILILIDDGECYTSISRASIVSAYERFDKGRYSNQILSLMDQVMAELS